LDIKNRLNSQVNINYLWFENNFDMGKIPELLNTIRVMVPFSVKNIIIPEMCYQGEVRGDQYEELISTRNVDEGNNVSETVDRGCYKTKEVWNGNSFLGGALGFRTRGPGAKRTEQYWEPNLVTTNKWVSKTKTYYTYGVYVDVFKIRFDQSRDFVRKDLVRQYEK